jgi:dTDP-4-dehydrorhamnose 3,5-epimerase-like enzyme
MDVSNAPLPGVVRIEPPVFADVRGFSWNGVRDSAADVSTCVRRAPRRIVITCYAA